MKLLSREFSIFEKILILVLCLLLVGLAYYQFVDKPSRETIAAAKAEQESLDLELTTLDAKLTQMRAKRSEMDSILAGNGTAMGSYNNEKAELKLLNEIFKQSLRYTININNVTRVGDQIRRNFTVQFTAKDYKTLEAMIKRLTASDMRLLIGDMNCSIASGASMKEDPISVTAAATFYETMVGGTPDAGLPASEAAAK